MREAFLLRIGGCLGVYPCEGIEIPVGLLVNVNALGDQWDCECIPDRACERTGCPVGLEMDQESIGITMVYVGVCEGGVGRLDCGLVLLHCIFYVLYSIFCLLSAIFACSPDVVHTTLRPTSTQPFVREYFPCLHVPYPYLRVPFVRTCPARACTCLAC